MEFPSLRYIFLLCVPYVAALSSISGLTLLGLHYTGFIWLITLVAGVLLILYYRVHVLFPWRIWLPWFAYVWISISWGGVNWRHNLQDPLQITTPLVVGIVASFSINEEIQLKRFMRACVFCLFFIALVFVFFWYGPGAAFQEFGRGYAARPTAMTVCLIGSMFVATVQKHKLFSVTGWTTCLAISVLSGSRMATLVLLLFWVVSPLYRRVWIRSLIFCIMFALALALFFSPIFQERFFASGEGTLHELVTGDFSSSGRFEVWPDIWREAKSNIVFGAGAGEVGRLALRLGIVEGFTKPCNDYLRILYEFGIVGLTLFFTAIIRQMHLLHKMMYAKGQRGNWTIVSAYLGFFSLIVLSFTENTIVYGVYYLHLLFAITGIAHGFGNPLSKISEARY